jgi:hypothetical protein
VLTRNRALFFVTGLLLVFSCAACSGPAVLASAQWPASAVAKAKSACTAGGGHDTECGCAVRYLEDHGAPNVLTREELQRDLDVATKVCVSRITSGHSDNTKPSGNSGNSGNTGTTSNSGNSGNSGNTGNTGNVGNSGNPNSPGSGP